MNIYCILLKYQKKYLYIKIACYWSVSLMKKLSEVEKERVPPCLSLFLVTKVAISQGNLVSFQRFRRLWAYVKSC